MAVAVFDAMAASRNLDLAARYLRKEGPGVYTIGSAGHESNAAVAAALRPTDPALLHYRSGGFYCARAQQVPDSTPLRDILLGLVAAADEPISGGRHKVFGNHALAVIPQTSTIASHVPRAMGVGFAIERAQRIGVRPAWPADAIVVCSFGDASLNHSTALGALNAAEYTVHQGLRMPVLFCCEDNGFGISVRTPRDWVSEAWSKSATSALFQRRGDGHRRRLRRGSGGGRIRAQLTPPRVSAPALRSLPRSCRQRRRGRLSQPRRDRRGPRARSPRPRRAPARGGRDRRARRAARHATTQLQRTCGAWRTTPPINARLSSASEVMEPIARRRPETVASDGDPGGEPGREGGGVREGSFRRRRAP